MKKRIHIPTASTVRITGRQLLQCGKHITDLTHGALRDSKGNIFDSKASYKTTDSRIWRPLCTRVATL